VDFAFSDEQEQFRETLRRFLAEAAPMAEVRRTMETPEGFDKALWKRMATELGLQGVHLPESYGGQGFSFLELGIVQEELGRALVPTPYFSTVCLSANAILNAGSEADRRVLVPALASGERTASLAWLESSGGWDLESVSVECRADGGSFVLDGVKTLVSDGGCAELLLVVARLPGTRGEEGITLLCVDRGASGVKLEVPPSLDPTRRQARLELAGARAKAVGRPGSAGRALVQTLSEATVCLAFEMIGGAARCLEMAVAYAKSRVQFARPIGSFQAVKHKCAEVLLELELARSAVYYAGWAAAESRDDLALAASVAKAAGAEAYLRAAAENIQIHGGVGFTFEYDPHLYYKRAKASEILLGDPALHRARLAGRLGL
jgi:alkylation response protein AidB-like acyl-CoA dehydrogenase